MLKGRLGLETARVPHADRHGLIWLERGELCVVNGCLHFARNKDTLTPTFDQIPHQAVSMILLGPGDLPPTSRTKLRLVKSVKLEQDGYEEEQIYRRADHWLSQTGRGWYACQGTVPQWRVQ